MQQYCQSGSEVEIASPFFVREQFMLLKALPLSFLFRAAIVSSLKAFSELRHTPKMERPAKINSSIIFAQRYILSYIYILHVWLGTECVSTLYFEIQGDHRIWQREIFSALNS